jgi:hypothetical protein
MRLLALFCVGVVLIAASATGRFSGIETRGSYSTVVLIGDTQRVMEGYALNGPADARYQRFAASIDWIISHAESERIEWVASLGDMIQRGIGLPPNGTECDAENGAPWRADTATCQPMNQATCQATAGCFWRPNSIPPCDSCEVVALAELEWEGFMAQWERLLPGHETTHGIPWLTIHGNHDNSGNQWTTDPDREPQGYNQRFSAAVWDALDNGYGPRAYEHVAAYDEPTFLGDGHAWRMRIGSREVLVVAASCCFGGQIAPGQEAWAVGLMNADPSTPAILLTHAAELVDDSLIRVAGDVAPSLFMVAGGHYARQTAAVWSDSGSTPPGTREVLRLETDWSYASPTDADLTGVARDDMFKVVRFWETGEVEVFDYSVDGASKHALPANTIPRRDFEVDP